MKDWTRLLLSVLPPPEEVSPRWRIPAGDDATAYPGDYLELMGLYGPGRVDDFLCLLAPRHPNENLDAHRLGPGWVKGIEELAGTVGERLPPEVEDFGDLVAWAGTDNGDMCFWIPGRRDPSAHLVAIRAGRDDEWSVHPHGHRRIPRQMAPAPTRRPRLPRRRPRGRALLRAPGGRQHRSSTRAALDALPRGPDPRDGERRNHSAHRLRRDTLSLSRRERRLVGEDGHDGAGGRTRGGAGGAAAVGNDRDRPPPRRDVHSALERCILHSRTTVGTALSSAKSARLGARGRPPRPPAGKAH